MKASFAELISRLPQPATNAWPDGRFDVEAMAHGTMSLQLFAPRGLDRQPPHSQDELYIIASGDSDFVHEGERFSAKVGDALFVAAGEEHRFENMSDDFTTWVIFWGPDGGEAEAPNPDLYASVDA
ncbi:cupin domain-containing protein [Jiella mangrovi]|uniref:Cupin domain-containing protein n=1 Tax=Jiella mangrovi TaxID=2821407 RepID=A0ABS4BMA0_9HYPH|nr:cupin domain-containing protein [Jiella mangrovi]MBP0617346.1 cupin domain-containing protein [Jiella mangrovi]